MNFTIFHFYPDLMNLYGSYANVTALARLLERAGHGVRVETVAPGGGADLSGADFVYMGAGTERRQKFALVDVARHADALRAAVRDGCPMLFAGTAMELLGQRVTDAQGRTFEGLGLAAFSAVQGEKRIVGDVYGHTDLFPEAVVGFMNKSATISGVDSPLLTALDMGFGNDAEGGPEGYRNGALYASELTGPLLVKNPRLLERVATEVVTRKGATPPEEWPVSVWARQGYAVTARELAARRKKS